MSKNRKLLIVQCAALGKGLLDTHSVSSMAGLDVRTCKTMFPALTCTAQATFRTGTLPASHGIIANGFFSRELMRPIFWEQSAALVTGKRLWHNLQRTGTKVGMFFWQQSLGEECDWIVSPAPIHKHHGGMIQSLYSKPADLGRKLNEHLGDFDLMHYWGPTASSKSSEWIAKATALAISLPDAPELFLTYLPALDYDLQRFGPGSNQAAKAIDSLTKQLYLLHEAAQKNGYELLIFGDYAIREVTGSAILPNRCLNEAGLFATRAIKGMAYPDFHQSRAFALVDHEIAHVYCLDGSSVEQVRACLANVEGIDSIMDRNQQTIAGLYHARSGDLLVTAKKGHWFAYPWWKNEREAPEYARHVDIHSKPGYDPCELFWGWPPFSVSRDTSRIKGTHGVIGDDGAIAWMTTIKDDIKAADICGLAKQAIEWIGQ